MTEPQPLMVPSTADAPTLTLACATLLASVYPQHRTPDEAEEVAQHTVDVVFQIWNDIIQRITSGVLVRPAE